jgi:hypothetical protein
MPKCIGRKPERPSTVSTSTSRSRVTPNHGGKGLTRLTLTLVLRNEARGPRYRSHLLQVRLRLRVRDNPPWGKQTGRDPCPEKDHNRAPQTRHRYRDAGVPRDHKEGPERRPISPEKIHPLEQKRKMGTDIRERDVGIRRGE